jgi:PAS domain S-box-containing protein
MGSPARAAVRSERTLKAVPTGREQVLAPGTLIVTKTDVHGRITYANQAFLRIAGYSEAQTLGQAHRFIRHPDMPRCVFGLLWDTIQDGREIFAFVVNLARNGDHYWVFAHVTPTFDHQGNIISYHSTRRAVSSEQIARIEPIYAQLTAIERRFANKSEGIAASTAALRALLADQTYEQFVFSIEKVAG